MLKDYPKTIAGVLEYYSEEVTKALAYSMLLDDKFPVAILNEIRSSYTHIGRANRLAPGSEPFESEIDAAFGHLKRTYLDCVKLSILNLRNHSDKKIKYLSRQYLLPNRIYSRSSDLRRLRVELSTDEGKNPLGNKTLNGYRNLVDEYDKFYNNTLGKDFDGDLADEHHRLHFRRRRIVQLIGLLMAFVIGFISSSLATMLFG